MTRKYTPIWEQLKRERLAAVRVHNKMTKTLIKAVYEEKRLDLAYKLQLQLSGLAPVVISSSVRATIPKSSNVIITLTLKPKVTYKGVSFDELC